MEERQHLELLSVFPYRKSITAEKQLLQKTVHTREKKLMQINIFIPEVTLCTNGLILQLCLIANVLVLNPIVCVFTLCSKTFIHLDVITPILKYNYSKLLPGFLYHNSTTAEKQLLQKTVRTMEKKLSIKLSNKYRAMSNCNCDNFKICEIRLLVIVCP